MSTALIQARDALRAALDAIDEALGHDAPLVDHTDLLEVAEAAEMAGVEPSTIRKWVSKQRRGRAQNWIGYKVGRHVYLSRRRFRAHIAGGAT